MINFQPGQEVVVGKYKVRNEDGIWKTYKRVGNDWFKTPTIPESLYTQFQLKISQI